MAHLLRGGKVHSRRVVCVIPRFCFGRVNKSILLIVFENSIELFVEDSDAIGGTIRVVDSIRAQVLEAQRWPLPGVNQVDFPTFLCIYSCRSIIDIY